MFFIPSKSSQSLNYAVSKISICLPYLISSFPEVSWLPSCTSQAFSPPPHSFSPLLHLICSLSEALHRLLCYPLTHLRPSLHCSTLWRLKLRTPQDRLGWNHLVDLASRMHFPYQDIIYILRRNRTDWDHAGTSWGLGPFFPDVMLSNNTWAVAGRLLLEWWPLSQHFSSDSIPQSVCKMTNWVENIIKMPALVLLLESLKLHYYAAYSSAKAKLEIDRLRVACPSLWVSIY